MGFLFSRTWWTNDQIRDLLRTARDKIDDIDSRVALVEAAVYRADVIDELPDNAPNGYLMKLKGDQTGAIYIGNGATRPLTKLMPVAL